MGYKKCRSNNYNKYSKRLNSLWINSNITYSVKQNMSAIVFFYKLAAGNQLYICAKQLNH